MFNHHRHAFVPARRALRREVVALALVMGVSMCFGLVPGTSASAASPPAKAKVSDANTVIATYLVNFLRYVEWPENVPAAGEPWRIGLLNAEGFQTVLQRMTEKKTVRGHPITVVYASDPVELRDCQIVLLGEVLPANYAAAAKVFSDRPLLTIAYHEKNSPTGEVMIELVLQGRNIRYRLNTARLTAQGLKPTPGLLENALPPAAPPIALWP